MTPDLDASRPKKKLSLTAKILMGIFALVGLFLLMPSANAKRIAIARKQFAQNFPIISEERIKPLLKSHLMVNDAFVYDVAERKECGIIIFAPDGPTAQYGDSMMSELIRKHVGPRHATQTAVLLAPPESSKEWTLFAKIWLAKTLQKQPVEDLKDLGLQISSNPKVVTRLKSIWKKVPEKVKSRSTQVLAENRAIASLYAPTLRVFRNGKTYAIGKTSDFQDFTYSYNEAFPELAERKDR